MSMTSAGAKRLREVRPEGVPPSASFQSQQADGQRFLVKVPAAQSERQRIHVLLNWTSQVK